MLIFTLGKMLIGWVLSKVSPDILKAGIDYFLQSSNNQSDAVKKGLDTVVEVRQIEAQENMTKWKFPWFWIMAGLLLGPVILYFWTLTLYNIFWWEYGLWPKAQRLITGDVVGWKIAAYPGIFQEWANTAFNWVFAPALGVGAILKILGKK